MMPQHAQCPQCAAPLPAGATRCQYCGFVTPWGATYAATAQRAAAIQADQAKRARIAKAEGTARTGMILALVGLPICCAPLSLVGAGLGFKGGNMAKAEGVPRPVTSVISMIVGAVSVVAFVGFLIMYLQDQQAKDDRLSAVRARLKGKRTAAVIDAKVACDIVEEHLVAKGHGGHTFGLDAVHCDGALAVNDRRASISDVRFSFNKRDHTTVTACLERRSRWFVLRLLDGGSCADLPPPQPFTPTSRALSEAEAEADEAKARADLDKAAHTSTVKAFVDRLAKVKADAARPGSEAVCSRADMSAYVTGDARRKVVTVDFDHLDAGAAGSAKDWPFLTSESVRKALDKGRSDQDRAKAIADLRAESGPLLVVYRADRKVWPSVTGKGDVTGADFSYKGGFFGGWLFVYDADTGARRCQTKLQFTSSEEVNFKTGRFASEKTKAKEAVEADFRDRFETAATDAIRLAAPDLRLGYKTVE